MDVERSFNVLFKFFSASLVFFMQAGFAMLEAGVVQRKNVKNILFKNLVDICIGSVVFWLFGYALAFGCANEYCSIVGNDNFALVDFDKPSDPGYVVWFFQLVFACTATTIVSGSVAERMRFLSYFAFAFVMAGVIYPVVAHWVWGKGWLQRMGAIDFAGGIVVHIVGGTAGLVGAMMLGPRQGRFEGRRMHVIVTEKPSYSVVFGSLGVLILWLGWYGFNCGSVGNFFKQRGVVAVIAINTTLGPVGASVSTSIAMWILTKRFDVSILLNSMLAGLVSITPGCAVLTPGFAFLTSFVGGLVCYFATKLLHQLKIDDPVDAAPIHLFGGLWGVTAVGLLARPHLVREAFLDDYHIHYGLFYTGSAKLLGIEWLGAVAAFSWTVLMSLAVFAFCKRLGVLRVSPETERIGIDSQLHGGSVMKSIVATRAVATGF